MKSKLLAIACICASLNAKAGESAPTMGSIASFDDSRISLRIFEFLPEANSSNTLLQIANRSSTSVQVKGKFGAPILAPGSTGTVPCGPDYVSMTFQIVDSQAGSALAYLLPTCGSQVVVIEDSILTDIERDKVSGGEE